MKTHLKDLADSLSSPLESGCEQRRWKPKILGGIVWRNEWGKRTVLGI